MASGTYRLNCGSYFYVGSSSNLLGRQRDHAWRLRTGQHPVKQLQEEFDKGTPAQLVLIRKMRMKPEETKDEFRTRLRAAEQKTINELKDDPGFCNRSPNARGPNNGNLMRELWKNPETRQRYMKAAAERGKRPVSAETRAKMSEAMKRRMNPKSKPVIVTLPNGFEQEFPSLTTAARFFTVIPQTLDSWIKGRSQWPRKRSQSALSWAETFSARMKSDGGITNQSPIQYTHVFAYFKAHKIAELPGYPRMGPFFSWRKGEMTDDEFIDACVKPRGRPIPNF